MHWPRTPVAEANAITDYSRLTNEQRKHVSSNPSHTGSGQCHLKVSAGPGTTVPFCWAVTGATLCSKGQSELQMICDSLYVMGKIEHVWMDRIESIMDGLRREERLIYQT